MSARSRQASTAKVDIDKTRNRLEHLGLQHAAGRLDELLAASIKLDGVPHRFVDQLLESELLWRDERRARTSL